MASIVNILFSAGLALIIYTCLGLPLTLRVAPRPLAAMLAPAVGWAIHSVVALPLFFGVGLSHATVVVVFAVPLAIAAGALWKGRFWTGDETVFTRPLVIALIGAALLALAVMAVDVPKISAQGVALAAPIFDHSKVSMIDEMARMGVPPVNPYFAGDGSPTRLSYYYLWHFSAAELSLLLHVSGWEADAGLSWFTAFTSLSLMIGFAVWLSDRAAAAVWTTALAATASVRPVLYAIFGVDRAEQFVGNQSGFGGWLFQTSWAPQHTASAMCAVLSIYLLVQTIERRNSLTLLIFVLTMAAGFESSTWVGGVTFPLAAAPVALMMLARAEPHRRLRIAISLAVAAALATFLISPFLYDQWQMSVLRGDGSPIRIEPYQVFSGDITDSVGAIFNVPAYWLIYLVVEFPAFYLTGLISLFYVLRDQALPRQHKPIVVAFAFLVAAGLCAAWLLVSTLGDNNDLGWRSVLPGVMLLIVFAATGLSRLSVKPFSAALVAAVVLILLGVPDSASLIYGNSVVAPNESSKAFAATPALWQAVRRHTAPNERVANNPWFMEDMTPWSVNISWALLANRRSCYAGAALVGPFSELSKVRQDDIDKQFARVFDGKAAPGDIEELATHDHCSAAVVVPSDGAWMQDSFATSPFYRLVEGNADWRIYRVVKPAR